MPLLIEDIYLIPRMEWRPRNRSPLLSVTTCQLFDAFECSIHFNWSLLFAKHCNLIPERLLEIAIVPLTDVAFFIEMDVSKIDVLNTLTKKFKIQ
jgi:hypothetical protein